ARQDVQGIFQWEFLVLLLDVFWVVTYFILVRTIDFGKDPTPARIDPASTVARWIIVIFCLYFVWDCITKGPIYLKKPDGQWRRIYGPRMIPTVVCLVFAFVIRQQVKSADFPHQISADFALLWLVLLFRALKDVVSDFFP